MILTINDERDLDRHLSHIDEVTEHAVAALPTSGTSLDILRAMKFDKVGFHPIDGRPLNLIEQINRTFTFMVALKATKWLLAHHPDAGGFKLAPGATMAMELDIMSNVPGLVGAETFAATHPDSNRKLAKDLAKLQQSQARFRYAFFYAPNFPFGRMEKLERQTGIEVHCIEI